MSDDLAAHVEAAFRARDARNRSLRTFLQGLGIDVLVAVAVLAYSLATSASAVVWAVVAASLARTVVQSAAAYVMRAFLDPSRVPTPLPPEPVGAPAKHVVDPR